MPTSSASEADRPKAHLQIENLTAGYGGAPIVNGASAAVGLGEIVTIVGPNGAGKSTLLKAVVGMIPAMSGRVLLAGEDVTNMRANNLARRGLGYVPQVNDVFDTLTVADNLEMALTCCPGRSSRPAWRPCSRSSRSSSRWSSAPRASSAEANGRCSRWPAC